MIRNPFTVKPSKYDSRDYFYKASGQSVNDVVDLRQYDSTIENQRDLGSCVGAAIVSAYEIMLRKNNPEKFVDLSILYAYYHARLLEDSETMDEGVIRIRNGLKGLNKFGLSSDLVWPYNLEMVNVQPELSCYVDGWPRKITKYESLVSIDQILEVINNLTPVVIGITVFNNFLNLSGPNSIVTVPKSNLEYVGGHAMCLVGYNLPSRFFIAKNSYGAIWGDNGYCYIPFDYLSQYSFDKWYFTIPNLS